MGTTKGKQKVTGCVLRLLAVVVGIMRPIA